ncbi:MAG: hypothetical protein AB7U45_01690 [Desulfamplus sp.]
MGKKISIYIIVVGACLVIASDFGCNYVFAVDPIFPFAAKKRSIPVESQDNTSAQDKIRQDISTQSGAQKKIETSTYSVQDKIMAPIPPMAEKHIFSPEPDISSDTINSDSSSTPAISQSVNNSNDTQQSIDMLMQKVNREVELTGIVITPSSKKAMILYKGKGAKKEAAKLYDEGTSIDDYLLKDIFSNYIIIAQNNQEVKLSLFKERSNRPEAPKDIGNQNNLDKSGGGQPININQSINSIGNPANRAINIPEGHPPINLPRAMPQSMQNNNGESLPIEQSMQQDSNSESDLSSNPFIKALQGSSMQGDVINSSGGGDSSIDGSSMGANPFLQAIQRARERQRSQ